MAIFFPILKSTEIYKGGTIAYNFPPNDVQKVIPKSRYLNLIWMDTECWKTKLITKIKPLESKEVFYDSIKPKESENDLLIMCITDEPLPPTMNSLPSHTLPTTTPNWRSTVCIHRNNASASYQGEIEPFPEKATLLSFIPFMQNNMNIHNYLIFVNLESKPISRKGSLKFSTIRQPELIVKDSEIKSNSCNFIDLNNLDIEDDELLVCYTKSMSGIPLFLSFSNDDSTMSLEHTHPPASFLIHGNRNNLQSIIKENWFNQLPL